MSFMSSPGNPFERRTFLRLGTLSLAAVALASPGQALAASSRASLRALGDRIRVLYPARAATLTEESGPRRWPHVRQKKSERLLVVDNWLLPPAIAQVALRTPNDG